MKTQLRASMGLLAVSCAMILTGCGGGGGGNASPTSPPPPPPPVSANQAPLSTHASFTVYTGGGNAGSGGSPFVDDPDYWDTFTVVPSTTPTSGTVTMSGTKFHYQANAVDFTGTDSFDYTVTDSGSHAVSGTALVRAYGASNLARCTMASTVNPDGTLGTRVTSGKCAIYGEAVTRNDASGNPVTVRYIAMRPSDGSDPKAVVFMIGGGDLNMKITGDVSTGAITTAGGNYVVRSAQLMADGGYLVIAMDRPTDRPTAGAVDVIADIDAYRVSVDQAIDILAVTHQLNADHLPLFLDGTSRGTISVVANNLISNGITLSSSLTSDPTTGRMYIGKPGVANLQASSILRPTYVVWHQDDACPLTTPTDSQNLATEIQNLGIPMNAYIASGGVPVTTDNGTVAPNVCGAFDYHGFMGIEPTVMGDNVTKIDAMYSALYGAGNHLPDAAFATLATPANTSLPVSLDSLVQDIDGDALNYTLPQTTTSLGGTVSLSGSTVTYTPPAGVTNLTDYFVYVVVDSNAGVNAGVVSIQIGN